MNYLLLALLILLFSPIASAQDIVSEIPPECRLLPDHKPSADVAYKPGVDVHGKSVVPADINATPFEEATQNIVVPLTVDLARRLQNNNVDGLKLEGNLGYLEIGGDGRITYNGQDWTSQVYVLCGKQPISANGQTNQDVIKYEPVEKPAPKPVAQPKPKPPVPAPAAKPVEKKGELIQGEEFREENYQ